jgi:oligosaccharide reducing-end xylanase
MPSPLLVQSPSGILAHVRQVTSSCLVRAKKANWREISAPDRGTPGIEEDFEMKSIAARPNGATTTPLQIVSGEPRQTASNDTQGLRLSASQSQFGTQTIPQNGIETAETSSLRAQSSIRPVLQAVSGLVLLLTAAALLIAPAQAQDPPAPNSPTFTTSALSPSARVTNPTSAVGDRTADRTADGSGAYSTGRYRNLFLEQHHPQPQIDAKIHAAFEQLFHGDKDSQTVYYDAGSNANGPLAYITDVANHDARTEGMSYGMMIAVQMNRKLEFDAIWNWANTYMLVTDPANPSNGYFAWSMNVDGTPRSDSPAPDGEEYFVMSLYFAANRWGSGSGIYDYKAQADRILSLMRHHPVQTATGPFRLHPNSAPFVPVPRNPPPGIATGQAPSPAPAPSPAVAAAIPPPWTRPGQRTVGPMVNEQYKMIRFVPNSGGDAFTDPSYHLPAFYELWARWGPAQDREFWAQAAVASRAFLAKVSDPATGLGPDRANFDGTWMTGRDGQPVPFSYDSWRTASNWSVDYSWWHKDPQEPVLSDRIQKFLFSQGVSSFDDRYSLDGKSLSQRHSTGMVATTATASLAATPGPTANAFLNELWNTPIPAGQQRYYDGMLYMLSLLHCSGEFRIWAPK